MTTSEFVNQVIEQMVEGDWQELPIEFNTAGRKDLSWLSIYEEGGVVHMDIGKKDE